jgi:hypothetical protein
MARRIILSPRVNKIFEDLANGKPIPPELSFPHSVECFEDLKNYVKASTAKGYRHFTYDTHKEVPQGIGRVYPTQGAFIGSIYRGFRGLLCEGKYQDCDIYNCHPVLLAQICHNSHIAYQCVSDYNRNRVEIIEETKAAYSVSKDSAKTLFIRLLYGGSFAGWARDLNLGQAEPTEFISYFEREMKVILREFERANKELLDDLRRRPTSGSETSDRTLLSYILQTWERRVVEVIFSVFKDRKLTNGKDCVISYDGVMLPADKQLTDDIIIQAQQAVRNTYGFDIKLVRKPLDTSLAAFLEPYDELPCSLPAMKKEWEKNCFKVVNEALYYKYNPKTDSYYTFTEKKLKEAHREIKYRDHETFDEGSFIEAWINMENIRKYDNVGLFPEGEQCPPNYYNLWSGFNVQKLLIKDIKKRREEEYEEAVSNGDTEAVLDESPINIEDEYDYNSDAELRNNCDELTKRIHAHYRFMCNNDEKTYEYLLNWAAHIFCFPAKKSGTAVLIKSTNQGVGKNRVFDMITHLIDGYNRVNESSGYVLETEEFATDITGRFNSCLLNKFFVLIDEPDKGECFANAEKFKKIITSPTFQCEFKGIDTVTKRSYHRFAIVSNEGIPIKVDASDRRFCIIEADGDPKPKTYYEELSADMESEEVQKAFYIQLLGRKEIVSNYDWIRNIPDTGFRQDLKEACLKPEGLFFEDYMRDVLAVNPDEAEHRVPTRFLHTLFADSPHKPVNYNPTIVAFTIALKNSFKYDWLVHKDCKIDGRVHRCIIVDTEKYLAKYPLPVDQTVDEAGPSNAVLMLEPRPTFVKKIQPRLKIN